MFKKSNTCIEVDDQNFNDHLTSSRNHVTVPLSAPTLNYFYNKFPDFKCPLPLLNENLSMDFVRDQKKITSAARAIESTKEANNWRACSGEVHAGPSIDENGECVGKKAFCKAMRDLILKKKEARRQEEVTVSGMVNRSSLPLFFKMPFLKNACDWQRDMKEAATQGMAFFENDPLQKLLH